MKTLSGTVAMIALAAAAPAAAQVIHHDDTQASLDIRLLNAAMFCMKWVKGEQPWTPDTLGMEDMHGAPTASRTGEAVDFDHHLDINLIAVEPRGDGCKVQMHTDQWDKDHSLRVTANWLVGVGKYTVFSSDTTSEPNRLFLRNTDGTNVTLLRYSKRPEQGQPDGGADITVFFMKP